MRDTTIDTPIDLVFGRPEGPDYKDTDKFVEDKLQTIEATHHLAREGLITASARSKRYYDSDVKSQQFAINSWVWFYSPRKYVGRSPKWQRNYSGPFLIVRKLNPVLFAIQKSKRAREILAHSDKLKPFLGVPPTSWLAETAPITGSDVEADDAIHLHPNQPEVTEMLPNLTDVTDPSASGRNVVAPRPKRAVQRPARFLD
jgi:hypothetical protein